MKKSYTLLYILVFLLVSVVGVTIYVSGKSHIDAVNTAVKLDSANVALQEQVIVVSKTYSSKMSKLDSAIAKKDSTIKVQKGNIFSLIGQVAKQMFVKTSSVFVHDTVFITEKKNFWGRTKTSVAKTETSVDSSSSTIVQEPILMGSMVAPVDSTK